MKFQTACSAAGPELGGYTQWVRWRAPMEDYKNKNKAQETYPDSRSRCQERLRILLEGGALGLKLGLNVMRGRVQDTCPAPRRPLWWGGTSGLCFRGRQACGPDLMQPWR